MDPEPPPLPAKASSFGQFHTIHSMTSQSTSRTHVTSDSVFNGGLAWSTKDVAPPLPPKQNTLPQPDSHPVPVRSGPLGLLGSVPPAPMDPFVAVQRSAAGTPLPPTVHTDLSAYTQTWNCSSAVTLERVTAPLQKKRTSDLIDLELDSLRRSGNVLDLFDPLKSTSHTFLPRSESSPPRPAAEDNNRALPKEGLVPAERETLRKAPSPPTAAEQAATSSTAETAESAAVEDRRGSSEASSPGSVSEVIAKRSEERLKFLECFRVEERQRAANPDVEVFWGKCKQLRSEFTHDDHLTNAGLVVSPTLDTKWQEPMSVRMEIFTPLCKSPFCFNCDVSTTIQHVISQVVCSANLDDTNMDNYVLKVRGRAEYLTADSMVREYEYSHWCVKFDKAICLTLLQIEELRRPWQRVLKDDADFLEVKSCELLPFEANVKLHEIQVYMETFRNEALRLLKQQSGIIRPCGVNQAVKAVCARLSRVDTPEILQALEGLERLCEGDALDLIEMERRREVVSYQLLQIQKSLEHLLEIYSQTFPVDFVVIRDSSQPEALPKKEITKIEDTVLFRVGTVCQPKPSWLVDHDRFVLRCELIYGWKILHQVETQNGREALGLFQKIDFDDYLELKMPMRSLPREAAVYVILYGINKEDCQRVKLGWFGLNLFSSKRELIQGTKLCPFWGAEVDQMSGPPCCSDSPSAPLLGMHFTEFDHVVYFPKVCHEKAPKVEVELDPDEERCLREMLDCDPLCSIPASEADKKFFWDRRLFVRKIPHLLPKVLLSRDAWSWVYLKDIYAILREWVPVSYISALTLLLPQFPDSEVRRVAVSWIKFVGSDELCDHLPQLVQALRFEAWEDSPVTWFLLERALTSTRVAHQMYWLLRQNEANVLSKRRVRMMMAALRIIAGGAFSGLIRAQDRLLRGLRGSADLLKKSREGERLGSLLGSLRGVERELEQAGGTLCLPLNPCLEVAGIDVRNCSYFTSNTLPLKVCFRNMEASAEPHEVIYKVGDDLRQDMLVLQMIRIMDKLWLKNGLDLRIITFECVATGKDEGLIEVVAEAETLRKIQIEHGLTGSFRDKPIAEWLRKHNGSEADYQRAVDNFSLSCAGYCVATYVLGVCDRHNDNIMLRPSGHMFHIDFGKFLGDAQMFGSIKRDRVPFVLTGDMVYVINGGDKPSRRFQAFVENCCKAFNVLRASSNVLITLFGLMVSSGIPGLNEDAVQFVTRALMLGKTQAEASMAFTQLVRDASNSMSAQMNFFIHNVAQMRFTGDHNDALTLNFAPKVHSKKTDGRLQYYRIVGCQKKYIPEKHYVYVILLRREQDFDETKVYRTHDEFLELHSKLSKTFPNAKFPPLAKGSLIGRSNTADVAEKRKTELVLFLRELQDMAEEIAHCDLVYTFFHPLYRDQETLDEQGRLHNDLHIAGPSGHFDKGSAGRIKLDLTFANQLLSIMVMHAENLRCDRKLAPDAYVKTYLMPDPEKLTKKKTRVVSRNKHPTFMALLSYHYPYETLRTRVLGVSVWDHDRVQGNEMIGSVYIFLDKLDLSKPHIGWFELSAAGKGFAG